jgi:hypothetical protein
MGLDMTMKLIKESEMKVTKGGKEEKRRKEKKKEKEEKKIKAENGEKDEKKGKEENEEKGKKEDDILDIVSPIVCVTKKSITMISAEKVIHCERRESGATSNCAICEGITKEIFDRCKNKWTDY